MPTLSPLSWHAGADAATRDIRLWFEAYTASFAGPDGQLEPLMLLKLDHTRRVTENAIAIARGEGWAEPDVRLGEAAALLHDAGRFPQLRHFRTFEDHKSLNHAHKSWEVARDSGALAKLPPEAVALLETAVCHHNLRDLPPDLLPAHQAFLKLVRDADKLDIYHVIDDALTHDRIKEYPEIVLYRQLDAPPGPRLLAAYRDRVTVGYRDLHSLGDFLLLTLLWLRDLNYRTTVQLMLERDIFARIARHLPAFPEQAAILETLLAEARVRAATP